jgi:hypothetical protein
MRKTNNIGYTAIELIGVLLVIIFLILVTNKYMNSINQTRFVNQLSDEAKNYSYQAIKYIEDNYRLLVQQSSANGEMILAWSSLNSYATSGNSGITNNHQTPCLYIASGMPNSIRVYIVFGNTEGQSTILNRQTIGRIAQVLGGNAGDLVNNNGNYIISGYIENEYNLSPATVNNIIQTCSFVSPLPKDTLIIDLTKNISMFASIKGEIDIATTANESDPTLKKSGTTSGVNPLTTMQTNLYLDNVVKESTLNTTYYCDATQLPTADAAKLCLNTAASQSINMYSGTAAWVSSILDSSGQNCIATANAHFYITTVIEPYYTCTGVPPPFPASQENCTNISFCSGSNCTYGVHQALTDYWGAPYLVQPSRCEYDTYAEYTATMQCSGNPCNWHSINPYNMGNQRCGYEYVNAIYVQQQSKTTDYGFKNCTATTFPAIESISGAPAQHVYKGIDFGTSSINGQRIQIKADAPNGSPVNTSQLDFDNVGIQAGYIAPNSHTINPGTNCASSQLGMIAQQTTSSQVLTSQLQCMYNPTFCNGSGYCFLPVKTSRFLYQYRTLQSSGQCPVGTIVDTNQPSSGVAASVTCPNYSGWTLIESPHGVNINCYVGVVGMSFCTGYQTVCGYTDQSGTPEQIAVPALAELQCTNASTTYIVDNYTP